MSETPMTTTKTTETPLPEEIWGAIGGLTAEAISYGNMAAAHCLTVQHVDDLNAAKDRVRAAIRKYLPRPPGAVDAVRAAALALLNDPSMTVEIPDEPEVIEHPATDEEAAVRKCSPVCAICVAAPCADDCAAGRLRALLASSPAPVLEPEHEGESARTLNMNDRVWVRLNDVGRRLLRDHYAQFPGVDPEVLHPDLNCEWTAFQLWGLAHVFGDRLYMGCTVPFETEIRLTDPTSPAPEDRQEAGPAPEAYPSRLCACRRFHLGAGLLDLRDDETETIHTRGACGPTPSSTGSPATKENDR